MVEAALGKRLSAHELAGAEMHEKSGGIDLLAADEIEAIRAAKRYLEFYFDETPATPPASRLDNLQIDDDYDMLNVVLGLADEDSFFELRPKFAPNLLTGFARIAGTSVGIIANQPKVANGAIDHNAATKIARFVELCNAYEYPMLALIDTPGCVANWESKTESTVEAGLTRWHMRPLIAHQQRTTPLISVQLRRGRGLGAALMTGVSSSRAAPAMKLAWPGVEIGLADGFSVAVDHNAFDDIIAPSETRERLSRLLGLFERDLRRTHKKHPIDTW